jgi:hypothetical protein
VTLYEIGKVVYQPGKVLVDRFIGNKEDFAILSNDDNECDFSVARREP